VIVFRTDIAKLFVCGRRCGSITPFDFCAQGTNKLFFSFFKVPHSPAFLFISSKIGEKTWQNNKTEGTSIHFIVSFLQRIVYIQIDIFALIIDILICTLQSCKRRREAFLWMPRVSASPPHPSQRKRGSLKN
jgi:hypothetical protein